MKPAAAGPAGGGGRSTWAFSDEILHARRLVTPALAMSTLEMSIIWLRVQRTAQPFFQLMPVKALYA